MNENTIATVYGRPNLQFDVSSVIKKCKTTAQTHLACKYMYMQHYCVYI